MQRILAAAGIDLDRGPQILSRRERSVRGALLEQRGISHREDDRLIDGNNGLIDGRDVVHKHILSFVRSWAWRPQAISLLYQRLRIAAAPNTTEPPVSACR